MNMMVQISVKLWATWNEKVDNYVFGFCFILAKQVPIFTFVHQTGLRPWSETSLFEIM